MMTLADREREQMIAEFLSHRYTYPECKYGKLPTITRNEAREGRKGYRKERKTGLEAKAAVHYR
jgi:hypothetical protein